MEPKYLQYVGNLLAFQEEINRICEGIAMGRNTREEYRQAAKAFNTMRPNSLDVNFADFAQFRIASNVIAPVED